jgi:hypothetical protein
MKATAAKNLNISLAQFSTTNFRKLHQQNSAPFAIQQKYNKQASLLETVSLRLPKEC